MNKPKKIKHLIIALSILAGLTFWLSDALIDKPTFTDEPFLAILTGNESEIVFRLLTFLFFLVFGVIAAKAFSDQKRTEDLLGRARGTIVLWWSQQMTPFTWWTETVSIFT